MAVKMRLKRMGQKKAPFYRVVVADARSPRDGRFIEEIGTYDPNQDPSVIKFDEEAAKKWLATGAQPTDTVAKLLKAAGIEKQSDLRQEAVTEKETADAVVLELHVAEGDMGKVIGKQGRIAKAIRTVVKASVDKGDKKIVVDIQQKIKSSQESVQKMYKTVGFLLCINSRK